MAGFDEEMIQKLSEFIAPIAVKKPGRPSKTPKAPAIIKQGIIPEPQNTNNIIEMEFTDPGVIKHILTFYNVMSSEFIYMSIDATDVRLIGLNHMETMTICTNIRAAYMSKYFTATKTVFKLSMREIHESLLSCINKSTVLLSFSVNKDDMSDLVTTLKHKDCHDKTFSLTIHDFDSEIFTPLDEKTKVSIPYNITFNILHSSLKNRFKTKLNNKNVSIQYTNGWDKMKISYDHDKSTDTFDAAGAITSYNYPEGVLFSADISAENMKKIMQVSLADHVIISCNDSNQFLFTFNIDTNVVLIASKFATNV